MQKIYYKQTRQAEATGLILFADVLTPLFTEHGSYTVNRFFFHEDLIFAYIR